MTTPKNAGPVRIPITRRALIQRIDRKLQGQGQRLRSHGRMNARDRRYFGDYVVVNDRGVVRSRVNLEALGRELEVLRPWESFKGDR